MRGSRGTLLIVLTLVAVGFAGCTDDPVPITSLERTAGAPLALAGLDAAASAALDRNASATLVDAAPVQHTFTGTFTPADVCTASTCDHDSAARRHDLSADVPYGVPVVIEVTTTTTADDAGLEVQVVAPDGGTDGGALFMSDVRDATLGFVRITPGPVYVEVSYPGPSASAPTVDYALVVDVVPVVDRLAAGAPVGLDLAPGGTMVVLPNEQAKRPVPVTLFAPDGTRYGDYYVDISGAEMRLPADAPAGTYVLVLGNGARPAALFVPDDAAPRALPTELIRGPRQAFAPDAAGAARVEGTLESDLPVLLARLVVETRPGSLANNGGVPGAERMELRVTSPAGTVTDDAVPAPFSCVLCPFPLEHVYASVAGSVHPAGTYAWHAQGQVGPEADAWLELVTWAL